jgi:hypothetical protein
MIELEPPNLHNYSDSTLFQFNTLKKSVRHPKLENSDIKPLFKHSTDRTEVNMIYDRNLL